MFRAHQVDAVHPADHLVVIPPVAPQPHQVFRKLQAHGERFFVRAPADGARSVVQPLHGNFSRGKLLENLLHALRFVAVHQGLFQLLQVDRRAIFAVDFADFIARQHVIDEVALFQPVDPFLQQPLAAFPARPRFHRTKRTRQTSAARWRAGSDNRPAGSCARRRETPCAAWQRRSRGASSASFFSCATDFCRSSSRSPCPSGEPLPRSRKICVNRSSASPMRAATSSCSRSILASSDRSRRACSRRRS